MRSALILTRFASIEGALLALSIGPNLVNIGVKVSNYIGFQANQIIFEGENISGLRSDQLFEKGVLRTFQIAHEFENLSVRENLMMVPGNQLGENILHTWMSRKRIKQQEKSKVSLVPRASIKRTSS